MMNQIIIIVVINHKNKMQINIRKIKIMCGHLNDSNVISYTNANKVECNKDKKKI